MAKYNKTFLTMLFLIVSLLVFGLLQASPEGQDVEVSKEEVTTGQYSDAKEVLSNIEIKGRASKTGYSREEFSNGWDAVDGCDTRNLILQRDLSNTVIDDDSCTVLSGTLVDPYSNKTTEFKKGDGSIHIDHVVSLSDAWQKGAQSLGYDGREEFYHDSLNLLAVDASLNQQKGDSDAASWLPPNRGYYCQFIERQVVVKSKYSLWATQAEYDVMDRILSSCNSQ